MRKLALTKSGTFWLKSVLSHCGWSFFHFYSWFLKSFTKAFKWDIICFLILMVWLSKLLKCFSENQLCSIICPWVYRSHLWESKFYLILTQYTVKTKFCIRLRRDIIEQFKLLLSKMYNPKLYCILIHKWESWSRGVIDGQPSQPLGWPCFWNQAIFTLIL